jgi:sulfofructose kinase
MRIPFDVPARTPSVLFDVVGIGQNSVDLLAVVAEYPANNSKQRLQRFARLPGGPIATALAVCSRLGWQARYVGNFGDDDLGTLSRESLVEAGVDVSASRTVAGTPNQFAIVLVDARSGNRTVLWDRHPALTMEAAAVSRDAVTAGRLLIVDCHETAAATEAARLARAAGIPSVGNSSAAIIASEAFPTEFTGYDSPGKALEAMAREFSAPLVCVTLGAHGSLARVGGREIRTPAFPIDCVDSTGAGDAFRGGFAAGCLRAPDADIEDVLTYANAVAALNCRALGARGAMPTAEEVKQLMSARPRT